MTDFIPLPTRAKDKTGYVTERLTVIGPVGQGKRKQILWLCQCSCGNSTVVPSEDLNSQRTKSCGCLVRERLVQQNTTHGMRYTRDYRIWNGILARCTNVKDKSYHKYGGRGISIYEPWKTSFEDFYSYIRDLPNYTLEDRSIDRTDNNGNYEPGNLQWATRIEQGRNTRFNRLITYQEETKCLTEWAEIFRISPATLTYRIKRGWTLEKALTTQPRGIQNEMGRSSQASNRV